MENDEAFCMTLMMRGEVMSSTVLEQDQQMICQVTRLRLHVKGLIP